MKVETEKKQKGSNIFLMTIPFFFGLGSLLVWLHPVIPAKDLIFSVGYLLYIHAANFISFKSNRLQISQRQGRPLDPFGEDSLGHGQFILQVSFKRYIRFFEVIAVLFPLILIFGSPSEVSVTAVPSIVTLIGQAIGEQSTVLFHDVLRILVPIGYNAYRVNGPLPTWVLSSYTLFRAHHSKNFFDWYTLNFILALVNILFWTWNLFVFLLLRVLPVYFDKEKTPRVEMAYTLLPLPKNVIESERKEN
mmetsp:Transcript_44901/g.66038  ORF Transcript_44901/g.66038 Transcript_44901/m.66038 type:complete len:248 (+) Transcript_44901:271-1014(+)